MNKATISATVLNGPEYETGNTIYKLNALFKGAILVYLLNPPSKIRIYRYSDDMELKVSWFNRKFHNAKTHEEALVALGYEVVLPKRSDFLKNYVDPKFQHHDLYPLPVPTFKMPEETKAVN